MTKYLEKASEYMEQCDTALATAEAAIRALQKALLDAHQACRNANIFVPDNDSKRLETALDEHTKFDIFELQDAWSKVNCMRRDASFHGEKLQKQLDAETKG